MVIKSCIPLEALCFCACVCQLISGSIVLTLDVRLCIGGECNQQQINTCTHSHRLTHKDDEKSLRSTVTVVSGKPQTWWFSAKKVAQD